MANMFKSMGGKKMVLHNGRWQEAARVLKKMQNAFEKSSKGKAPTEAQREMMRQLTQAVMKGKSPKGAKPKLVDNERGKNLKAREKARQRVMSETDVTKEAYKKKEAEMKKKAKKEMAQAKGVKAVHSAVKTLAGSPVMAAKPSEAVGTGVGKATSKILKGLRGKKLSKAQRAKLLQALGGAAARRK